MAPGWRLRRGSGRREEGTSNGEQRHADAGATDAAGRTETGNPDAPLDLDGDDDGAPESLDFQTIYNAAFELRRSSLDPGRRAAFESVESLDLVSAVSAVSAAGAAEADGASASADGDGGSPLVVEGAAGDTSGELKLRGKPFLG